MDFRRSLKDARQVSEEHKGSGRCRACVALAGVFCSVAVIILVAFAVLGVGIAKLVMGGIYFQDCDLDSKIPIFLIVDACVGFLLGGRCGCCANEEEQEEEGLIVRKVFAYIVGHFQIAWLICGTIWIVNVRDTIYAPDHCQAFITSTTTAPLLTNTSVSNLVMTTASGILTTNSSMLAINATGGGSIIMTTLMSNVTTLSAAPSVLVKCLTCAEALVDFTFGVVIYQWCLVGLVVITICCTCFGGIIAATCTR